MCVFLNAGTALYVFHAKNEDNMLTFDRFLSFVEENALKILFIILPLLCFMQVICRFIFHFPVPWSEETMRILFIWATFIGCSLAVKRGGHLTVTAFVRMLPEYAHKLVAIMVLLFCCIMSAYLSYTGFAVSALEMTTGQITPVLGIPTIYSSMALPVGFLLMSTRFALLLIERIRPLNV